MTYAPPPPPPPPNFASGGRSKRQWWKAIWVLPAIALTVGIGIGAAGGKTTTKKVAGPTTSVTATATATMTATTTPTKVIATRTRTATITYTPPPPKAFGDGTYVVGTEIHPGTYHADGGSGYCAWVRLSNLSGSSGIIDLGNSSGGPLTVEILPSDKGFEVQGDCTFHRTG